MRGCWSDASRTPPAQRIVKRFRALPRGQTQPNTIAQLHAEQVCQRLASQGVRPASVEPSEMGGMLIRYVQDGNATTTVCLNDGAIVDVWE